MASGEGPAFAEGGNGGAKPDPNDPTAEHGDGGAGGAWGTSPLAKANVRSHCATGGEGNASTAGTGGKAWVVGGTAGGQNGAP